MDERQRAELFDRVANLVDVAAVATVREFGKRLDHEVRAIQQDDGLAGRPEFVVVIDSSQPDGAGGPIVDWGVPVEVPWPILADMTTRGDVHSVVLRDGVVIHAVGELSLGRATRLANRAQRRALRALYATCAIPGCGVRYDHCRLHHVVWWRHGGRTDLDNLLPVCTRHHQQIHDQSWQLSLGSNRELSLTLPDGTIHNTGPPNRRAA